MAVQADLAIPMHKTLMIPVPHKHKLTIKDKTLSN